MRLAELIRLMVGMLSVGVLLRNSRLKLNLTMHRSSNNLFINLIINLMIERL